METHHRVFAADSRSLSELAADSVELVVTSPPYPMIEMWDSLFTELDPDIETLLETGEGKAAFEAMHAVLDQVWDEVSRVLVDGGIACINVGDATRKVDDSFRVFQNHSRVIDAFEQRGFEPLPEILWRKPVNSGAKFMGSGMLPPNAYVTLEHEYVLIFRNGKRRRDFEPGSPSRYASAYFWEERNRWFSDVWTDVRGDLQALEDDDLRDRAAAYPFAIPYRLINMYSIQGDTVLDPFWGTGTTTLAAMVAGRHSVGYERDAAFLERFGELLETVPQFSRQVIDDRLAAHEAFVRERQESGETFSYEAEHYDFPVMTKQERSIQFQTVSDIEATDSGYVVNHESVSGVSETSVGEGGSGE